MLYGIYLSAQGAEAQAFRQSVVANNMANAGTAGFKPDLTLFRAHFPHDVEQPGPHSAPEAFQEQTGGVSIEGTVTDYSQGPLTTTGGPLDVALVGAGFLQVSDGEQQWLTRNGRLTMTSEGLLVTAAEGYSVLGDDGSPIEIPPEAVAIEIGSEGQVIARDPAGRGLVVGRLGVVEPGPETTLLRIGTSRYAAEGEVVPALDARVQQGVLEGSGVEPVTETVELIEAARAFEMNMNLIRMQDETLSQLLQSMPRR